MLEAIVLWVLNLMVLWVHFPAAAHRHRVLVGFLPGISYQEFPLKQHRVGTGLH